MMRTSRPGEARAAYAGEPAVLSDHARSIYLQTTIGCAGGVCVHCARHAGRPARPRDLAEFRAHVEEVAFLLGSAAAERRSLLLGDADGLAVPLETLGPMIDAARAAFPGRTLEAFSRADLAASRSPADWAALRQRGLARVLFELDTAHVPLYVRLDKPGIFLHLFQAIQRAKAAGIHVGLTVLLGLGGRAWSELHVEETARYVLGRGLGRGDAVHLVPFAGAGSAYLERFPGAADPASSAAEMWDQMRRFQERLRGPLEARGVRLAVAEWVSPA
jgi:hypothetical protein